MERPLAIIIEDDRIATSQLKEALQRTSLGFKVKDFTSLDAWENYRRDDGKRAQIYFIGYTSPPTGGSSSAKKIREAYPNSAVVLMSSPNESPSRRTIKNPDVDDWLDKPVQKDGLDEVIGRLRKGRKLNQKISLGIIGVSGRLGRGALQRAYDLDCTSRIDIFSGHVMGQFDGEFHKLVDELLKEKRRDEVLDLLREKYNGLYKLAGVPGSDNKVVPHLSLDSIVASEPDILFVATGKHIDRETLKQYPKRAQWYLANLPKNLLVFDAIERINPKSLIVVQPNPPEPIIGVGIQDYGLNPETVTSISAGTLRYQKELFSRLPQYMGPNDTERFGSDFLENLNFGEIDIPNIGKHGDDFPVVRKIRIRGNSLEYYFSRIFESPLQEELIEAVKHMGTDELKAALDHDDNYADTQRAFLDAIVDIATFQESPRSCWSCYHNQAGVSYNWPTRLVYPGSNGNVRVHVTPDYRKLREHELSPMEFAKLKKQVREIELYIANRHNPDFFKDDQNDKVQIVDDSVAV